MKRLLFYLSLIYLFFTAKIGLSQEYDPIEKITNENGLSDNQKEQGENGEGLYADLFTNRGRIRLKLEYKKTPMTVANFVGLAEGTIKNAALAEGVPYYNGAVFHRVVPGHVIQAGIPAGTEQRGPGYVFPNEIDPGQSHNKAGMLGMANAGPHTNSAQFYITLGDRSYLDGNYTLFGEVIDGMDVVFNIAQGDTIKEITIIRQGKEANKFRPDTEYFNKLVEEAKKRLEEEEQKKKILEEGLINTNWPEAVSELEDLRYIILKEGNGDKPAEGDILTIIYSGQILDGESFYSTSDEGKADSGVKPETFEFEIGNNTMNKGFDRLIKDMKMGEKRIMIVPAGFAYGSRGFYGPNQEGKKRFVISPGATLVYEVEVLDIIFKQ